jgi:hypothetical protein
VVFQATFYLFVVATSSLLMMLAMFEGGGKGGRSLGRYLIVPSMTHDYSMIIP